MIAVSHLTKRFGAVVAVDDVTFSVERGEVVGFLGVNGAGKTTTLRILAGFLPATSGIVEVAGYDVLYQSLEVRRRIGYLPENAPLYPEMRVDEYLLFRARLKEVPSRLQRRRLHEVKERCGLTDVGRRLIGQLSRGYRQRVGLADCLIHAPELLILDEPTLGLDPAQALEVRELIRSLGGPQTILLSTHILPEVEQLCSRVLIIHRGRLIASGVPQALRQQAELAPRIVVEVLGPEHDVVTSLQRLSGVRAVTVQGRDGEWVSLAIETEGDQDLRGAVFEWAVSGGWRLRELRREHGTLEEVFVQLTRQAGETL